MRALAGVVVAVSLGAPTLHAQAVPVGSPADRVERGYRRTPSLRVDPFRHVTIPHWGFVFSAGARAANNSLNLRDVGAFTLLDDSVGIKVGEVIDALGLVPRGEGIQAVGQGEGGFYLGGPLPGGLSLGLSVQARGYGAGELDDNAVALLRDGNAGRQEFTLGNSRATSLVSSEFGVHGLLRLGPVYSVDGPRIVLGAGARLVRPFLFGQTRSRLENGGRVLVTNDSVAANLEIEAFYTPLDTFRFSTAFRNRGTGFAADLLLRLEWPTNGLAVEAMLANLGSVTVEQVEQRLLDIEVATTVLDTVIDVVDTAQFAIIDTIDVDVTLPRIARVSASAWANSILQLDLAATFPVGGDFPQSFAVDLGSTWRFIRTVPLRAGLIFGERQGVGFSGGFAVEGRTMFLQVAGQSLGGLFKNARGVAGRFELGFFF